MGPVPPALAEDRLVAEVKMRKPRLLVVGIGLVLLLLLFGCLPEAVGPAGDADGQGTGAPGEDAAMSSPFETIERGFHSGLREARAEAIRGAASWAALWRAHVGPSPAGEEKSAPFVDFTQEMVLAFFLGEQRTSGYEATIARITQEEARLLVSVEVTSPPPGAMLLQVLTQPYHLVRTPRSDLPVEFAVHSLLPGERTKPAGRVK